MDQKVYHSKYEICMSSCAVAPSPTPHSFPQRKESFLCCLIELGTRINELFVCVCVCVPVWKWKKKDRFTEWMVLTERSTEWQNKKKMLMDLKVGVRLKEGRRKRRAGKKEKRKKKTVWQIIKQKDTLLGTVNKSNIYWLIVSHRADPWRPCVCLWAEGGDEGPQLFSEQGGHAPVLETLQQSHIVKPDSPVFAPPPCSQFMIVFVCVVRVLALQYYTWNQLLREVSTSFSSSKV